MINAAALATATVNIVGNTRGLEHAIGESRKQMYGFLTFAQAIGGKSGAMLANLFAGGGAAPVLSSVLGKGLGGRIAGSLQNAGLLKDPVGDVAKALDAAKAQFRRDSLAHRVVGTGIRVGGVFNGQPIQNAQQAAILRAQHAANAPKWEDYLRKSVAGAATEAGEFALTLSKAGAFVAVAGVAFRKLAESGAELDRQYRKAANVFGSNLSAAAAGFGGIGSNISRSQYLAGAAGIGQEFAAGGVGPGRSSSMTASLTRRASELAAQWSVPFEDAAGKVQSALAGSNNALNEFGVVLSDDLVRANAFNKGMIRLHETMSGQVAVLSRYDLILNQTESATKAMSQGFFNLDYQWSVFTSNITNYLQTLGSYLSPVAAGLLGLGNALAKFLSVVTTYTWMPFQAAGSAIKGAYQAAGIIGPDAVAGGGADRQALMAQVAQDAKRADEILRRERSRQSSNVGYHSPEAFYEHIQKGIFGDPVEFAKRQADLLQKLLIVSQEQYEELKAFGYKVKNAAPLLQP